MNKDFNEARKNLFIALLNSMTTNEVKDCLNSLYGLYADTDSIKVYKHCEELLYKIREVDSATEKTFRKVYSEIKDLHIGYGSIKGSLEIDSARINEQAEAIEKLCKVIKFILPRVNANPFGKEYEEIKNILEDIYKEF